VDWRILPYISLLYLLSFLDRVSFGVVAKTYFGQMRILGKHWTGTLSRA